MIHYEFPSGFEFFDFYKSLFLNNGEYTRNDSKEIIDLSYINSFYDFPSKLKWNGGRVDIRELEPISQVMDRVNFFNDRGVGIYFTFTNSLITEEDLNDERGNEILSLCHNELNGVIVTSNLFGEYVRSKYPRYKLINSCISGFETNSLDYIMDTKDKYDIIVLPHIFNKIREWPEGFPFDKLTVFPNNPCNTCMTGTRLCKEHYNFVANLNHIIGAKPEDLFLMQRHYMEQGCMGANSNNFIYPNKEDYQYFISKGVNKFKIFARQISPLLILSSFKNLLDQEKLV
jgi:hypothetical protein